MEFEFSIRATLRSVWPIFTKNIWYFGALSLVMVVINLLSKTHASPVWTLVVFVASIIWTYVTISSVLAAIDGKEQMLRFDSLKLHLPTFRQFIKLFGLTLASFVMVVAGFIMLILPGIYFMIRLLFSNFAFVDRQGSIIQSMRFSWRLVKGEIFWTVFLAFMVTVTLILLGLFLFGIGILVTYPIAMLFLAKLYRELVSHQPKAQVVEQPKEISPVTPSAM